MAVANTSTSVASLTRAGAYLSMASDWTVAFWYQPTGTPTAGLFQQPFGWGNITDGTTPYIAMTGGNTVSRLNLEIYDGANYFDTVVQTTALNTWVYIAMVYDHTAHTSKWYVGGTLIDTLTVNLGAIVFVATSELALSGSYGKSAQAYYRVWQRKFTLPELTAESTSVYPVITTGLLSDTLLAIPGDLTDSSGNGHTWTHGGAAAVLAASPVLVPFGTNTLLIPSDGSNNRGVMISAVDGALLGVALPIILSELGAQQQDTGKFGLLGNSGSGPFTIYDENLTVTATSNIWPAQWRTTSPSWAVWPASRFYNARFQGGSHTITVGSCNEAGTVGGTTWSLDTHQNPGGIAINDTETVLYFANTPSTQALIRRHDLNTNLPLSDFYAGPVNSATSGGSDILIDPGSGNILFPVNLDTTAHVADNGQWTLFCCTTTGSVVWSVDLGLAQSDGNDLHLTRDIVNTDVFWVRTFPDNTGNTTTFTERRYADGGIVRSFTVDSGTDATDVPGSCPFFAASTTSTPTTPDTRVIRRVRTFPLPSVDNRRIVMHWIEFLLVAGMALPEGDPDDPAVQGSDPQVMFRMSYDGGMTWGTERWASAGKIGDYTRRVRFMQCGQFRQAVAQVIVSDPIPWVLIDCFGEWTVGTS